MRYSSLFCSMALMIAAATASTARPVLIEEFTATWCPYCYGAGLALDRIEAEYPRSNAIILVYHINDDYVLDAGITKYYYYGLNYIPTTIFNGVIKEEGYGSLKSAGQTGVTTVYNKFVKNIDQETSRTDDVEPFRLTLTGNVGPANPKLTLTVLTPTGYPRAVKARFYIVEDGIPVTASNGQTILNGVARVSLGEQQVYLPTKGGTVTLTASLTGTVPNVNATKLRPVVFLQDDTTQEVLAAVGVFYVRTAARSSWLLYR